MPAPSWEDLDEFLDTDDEGGFAFVAVFSYKLGGGVTVNGIFEDATFNAQTGEFDADISNPRFICKACDVEQVNRFDTVLVNEVTYMVASPPIDDGTGMATVRLSPTDPEL